MNLLVPESVARFDLSRAPGMTNPGGGMGTKYARAEEVLSRRYPTVRRVWELEQIDTSSVIVDALWFPGEMEEKIDAFLARGFRFSMLYGSQENLLSWPERLRQKLLSDIDVITHNCEYQRAMYRSVGIYHSQFLCDAVPEEVFSPAPKEPRIFASGQISTEKNTPALIELFYWLQDLDIQTCYMGSATLWGESVSSSAVSERYQLQAELESVTDEFHGNLSQAQVARISNTSAYHVHVAHYDCSCQNQQEAALGGAVLFGLGHPINAERPVMGALSIEGLVDAITTVHTVGEGQAYQAEIHEHALRHWSYEAFLGQFDKILQGV